MNKDDTAQDELRDDYSDVDLGPGVRGKYVERLRASTNLVLLEPDIAEAFPTERQVNDALRGLLHRKAA